jgi:hypothetical protein
MVEPFLGGRAFFGSGSLPAYDDDDMIARIDDETAVNPGSQFRILSNPTEDHILHGGDQLPTG